MCRCASFYKNLFSIVFIFLISTWPYSNERSLHADFAYDDEGTVVQNRVVRPDTPLEELWKVDFWSQELTSAESHKSYRPLTTLTYRWNYARSELDTYEYHIVNVILHGLVTLLVFWALNLSFFEDDLCQKYDGGASKIESEPLYDEILELMKKLNSSEKKEELEKAYESTELEIKQNYIELYKNNPMIAEKLSTNPLLQIHFAELEQQRKSNVETLKASPDIKNMSNKEGLDDLNLWLCNIFEFLEDTKTIFTIPFLTSIFFGIHSVHTEAVCNITGRAELLYSMFYLLGFVFYYYSLHFTSLPLRWIFLLLTCVCTVISVLCKEGGMSMPGVCAGWHMLYMLLRLTPRAKTSEEIQTHWLTFFFRFLFLCAFTGAFAFIRLSWNGESPPDFTYKQNPAALNENRLTRMLSIPWVWCLYLWTLFYPAILSCDWSGDSIQLLTSFNDARVSAVIALFSTIALLVFFVINRLPFISHSQYYLALSFLFLFLPFFLSSNIVVAIGAMKAERLIYLPSLGFCMMFIFLLWKILTWLKISFVPVCVLILSAHFHRLTTRVPDWDDSLNLWEAAYEVNKISLHTKYNYALNLTKHKRWKEAHDLLSVIISKDKNDSASMFLLCLVYINTDRCPKAVKLAKKGLKLPQLKEQRNRRTKSNLMTVLALCETDFAKRGKLHYESVEVDPGNNYAVQRAQAYQDLLVKAGILKE